MEFTKEELVQLSNLLYTGKWGLSMQETDQVVKPLIAKISREIEEMEKPKDIKKSDE